MSLPEIPSDAIPFYASDALSLAVQPGNPWNYWAGVFNTQGTIGNSKTVDIWLSSAQLALKTPNQSLTLINVDMRIVLYDLSTGQKCTPEIVANYPWNSSPALLANSVTGYNDAVAGRYDLPWPVPARLTTPASGGPFLIGPKFSFFSGLAAQMQCHLLRTEQGAWKAT